MEEDERDDRVKERDGEGEGGRVDRMRGGKKKGVAVFGVLPLSISFTRRASSTLYLVKKQLGERNARLPALSGIGAAGKPQHRGIMGNHRRKHPKVNPIIRETLSC